MVHAFVPVRPQGGECVGVSASDRGIETGRSRARGVCSHPSLASLHRSRWHGGRWLGRQLVETCERLLVAVGVEPFLAHEYAISSEGPELDELNLEGAA